jgi:hypothetical protein
MICPACHGTGKRPDDAQQRPCSDCGGSGFAHCCEGERCQPGEEDDDR